MQSFNHHFLVINGGSSSIKFALFQTKEPFEKGFSGEVERVADLTTVANTLIDRLQDEIDFATIQAIGHRVVQGVRYIQPTRITKKVLEELHRFRFYDPNHLPGEIALMEGFRKRYPKLLQVAFFDTEFHHNMPRVAKLLPIPRHFDEMGIQRYGFHGLSYSYLMEELHQASKGRVILAHLGNGASLAAVRDGKSVDTSMGFTPTSGIPMSTRTGDLDPGVAWYLMKTLKLTPKQFNDLINHKSGLLGISETSSDVRDLLKCQKNDVRAAEAIELFCYQTRKWIGSFAVVLGGVDTLVFSGGIGENSPEIRSRICKDLSFLGIELHEEKNIANAQVISREGYPVSVRVIKTNEEIMIAKGLSRFLKKDQKL